LTQWSSQLQLFSDEVVESAEGTAAESVAAVLLTDHWHVAVYRRGSIAGTD
jgi:hypothetical protein